jgi:hypothetical protein
MASNRFKARTDLIATGTSTKTLLQLVAAANHAILIDEWSISFDGTSNTAQPIRVDVLRQTTAGTMGTSASTIKFDPDSPEETIQTTRQDTATAEPTAGDILFTEHIHPQQGYTWQAPAGRQIRVPGGGRLRLRVLAPAGVNAVARFCGEE